MPQPIVAPAPSDAQFLSRYDFHLTAALLVVGDPQFSWDTHFGGTVDIADYVAGRTAVSIDYQAVLGSEYRGFDPNQANYTLEASSSARLGERTELAGVFHHVSRHLSDRPKRFAIAWNEAGARMLHRVSLGVTTVDVDLEGGLVVQHSFVDYNWIGELNLLVRHPLGGRVAVFAQGSGQMIGVDDAVNHRGLQAGGLVEAGLRITGRAGVLELFAGVEKRIDANPIDAESRHWGLAGFRLLSR